MKTKIIKTKSSIIEMGMPEHCWLPFDIEENRQKNRDKFFIPKRGAKDE